ncbi:MAG: DegT/DnrJ/EryC1/StrS family aminotransferase [Oscillospiraceae bacterium]|nr:DegT/DnrJ/EryC1/StrS family aminotransferase [Oscillospiraceae bacterium]
MQFRDLRKQYEALKPRIDAGIAEVIDSAKFISGPQVGELEKKLADYVGAKHCVTCANGTDAITIGLMAWDIGPGDAVFVPDFTFFSSGECPAFAGATPIFVDVDGRTYNLDPEKLEIAVKQVQAEGKYAPKAVVAVDLFGLPANYDAIRPVCEKYGLLLLEDGAQGFGGSLHGKKACSFGDISTTSFFPAKPLGCYGDGGAIFTDNDAWADKIRSICVHGKDTSHPNDPNAKYNNIRIGMNSRLDTLQAAILLPKLEAFREYELEAVNQAAARYSESLRDTELLLPEVADGFVSSWAQYTVQLPASVERAALQKALRERGVPTMVYYAKPMHAQGAFAGTDSANADCAVTERLCQSVLSLPIHPYLSEEDVKRIVEALKSELSL